MDGGSIRPHKELMAAGHPRVLIVDDDPIIREVVAAVLDDGECELSEANDGLEAMRLVTENPPDVIVVDVMMPGMTGYEVVRRLRADPSCAGTGVVMLTALDSPSARDEGSLAGVDTYLTKPFSALDLLGAVSEAVLRARR